MKTWLFWLALSLAARAEIVINEVDADQTGTDAAEFIELYDGGAGNTPLTGYVLVLFNGSNDLSYHTFDLAGKTTTPEGYFVIGNPAVPNVGLVVAPGAGGAIQNGADAVALYKAAPASFPNGTPLTKAGLVDALVYGTNDPDDAELLAGLTPGGPQANDPVDQSMSRIPDGGAPFQSGLFQTRPPTPGSANEAKSNLAITLAKTSVAENAGPEATSAKVTRTGPVAQAATISVKIDDPSELSAPATVLIPAGQTEASFPIAAVDDGWPDGSQKVVISVSAPNLNAAQVEAEVLDDGDKPGLVVNEVYADDRDDANGDGQKGNGADEFVELVNASDVVLDLSLHTVHDGSALRHTFPIGTKLDPGCALILFGGGNIAEGRSEAFFGALVQKANGTNDFGLGLNNTGDIIRVLSPTNFEIAGDRFGAVDGASGSRTRNPDLTGEFAAHADVAAANYSPGARSDGFAFCRLAEKLTLKVEPASFLESAKGNAAQLTVERSGSTEQALAVILVNSDPSEIKLADKLEIPAGSKSAMIAIEAVDDKAQDGTQTVLVSARAPGFLDGQVKLEVQDDGDPPVVVLINELDADQPGDETGEFVELYDGGGGNIPLDGLVLVLFNGANGQSYQAIDLGGKQTNAAGFFVVGDAEVPKVDLAIPNFTLQNGPDGVAIFRGSKEDFPNNTPVTAEGLVDALVYGTADTPAANLLDVLTPAETQANEGSSDNTNAVARVPDGGVARKTGGFVAQKPSPGIANGAPIVQEQGYPAWAKQFAGIGSPTEDSDGDGLANAFEYAWRLDPLKANEAIWLPSFRVAEGKQFLSYRSPKNPPADAKLSIEKSPDLKDWAALLDKEAAFEITPNADGTETILVTIPREAPSGFLRLRLSF